MGWRRAKSLRHCEKRKQRSNPVLPRGFLDRFARNDENPATTTLHILPTVADEGIAHDVGTAAPADLFPERHCGFIRRQHVDMRL